MKAGIISIPAKYRKKKSQSKMRSTKISNTLHVLFKERFEMNLIQSRNKNTVYDQLKRNKGNN